MTTAAGEQLAAAVLELKRRIRNDAQAAVNDFEEATGLTPSAIGIDMIDVSTHSDKLPKRLVSGVTVNLGEY